MSKILHIIGGGLAGSEAAWQAALRGIQVVLHEMRPVRPTEAHHSDTLAELVCSNSLRSDDAQYNAVGLMHEELRRAGSLIMRCADEHAVPAGGALAVDRDGFAKAVQTALENHENVTIVREEITEVPTEEWGHTIIATGPLTSEPLANSIKALTGEQSLHFFDAIAPIIHKDSIDFSKAWFQSRYDKGDGSDYINLGMTRDQYEQFIDDLIAGEKMDFKEWEKDTPYFEACLPIEVMAERGRETLAFGPMKPVGLTNPNDPDTKLAAVVQLRQDNKLGTLYNMVGFQTKLRHGEQTRIFKTIPGLENASFARLGGIHRNTFINSPRLLDETLRLKQRPNVRFAGQVTGCEGYVESTAVGLMAGRFAAAEIMEQNIICPPDVTALGGILTHITGGADAMTFQPMNINFGLLPPMDVRNERGKRVKGKEKKAAVSARALTALDQWLMEAEKV
ncbi:MAG: methylenetetrahydrofolate--tRNA-(uracil(54)-C(5))-methyltransferase (FADH(2)-oxidizing) TrmFO [Methylocystaceae bacterium]|nr:methylenetetrahydrofolate--tRNA-(uracil(54)-C(5))-methyltransferase (FADH(2)-oxidizing) TrmFO [Methylocystaceae bacterium]